MNNNSFTRYFIERPIFATVISLLAVLAGLFSLKDLPITQYPDITPPTVMVSATFPGADPSLVATTIGVPIEEAINGVENMIYMSSQSGQGSYSLTVTFQVGTDIEIAAIDVQNKLNTVLNTLPSSVIQQGVTVTKSASNMLLIFSMLSTDSLYNDLFLTNYASLNITNELARVDGVGQVQVFGAGDYSLRVWMDPNILEVRKVSADDVFQAIKDQNLITTGGSVGAPPIHKNTAFEFTLLVQGQLQSVEQFENIIIKSSLTGEYLRLKDIANIELGSVNYAQTTSYNQGRATSLIAVSQFPGANALSVAKACTAKMEQLAEYFPEGLDYEVTLNTTSFIMDSIREVIKTFFETLLLVIIVILFFLQSFRAVIIPAITIPISLICTFAFISLLNFTINLLTLFGLILSIAIVVDDAIVVVENSYRLMEEEKKDVKVAVEQAISELLGPIIAIDLCMLAVFVPTSFISGITGQLIRQFALTIAASTIISGFISLTLTPALCALFLKVEPKGKFFLFRWFNVGYSKFSNVYDKAMKYLLSHVYIAFIIFGVASFIGIMGYIKKPASFLPTEDQGYFMIIVQLPDAASTQRTTEVLSSLGNNYLSKIPEIETYISVSGFSMMAASSSNSGMVWVVLKDYKDRKGKGKTAMDIVKEINQQCYFGIPEATVYAINPPPIPGLGSSGGLTLELQDINNLGFQELYKAYLALEENKKKESALGSMQSFYSPNVPQYQLEIDRDKLRILGLQFNQVSSALNYFLGSAYVNDFIDFNRVYHVTLEGETDARTRISDIMRINLLNSQGEMVPLSSFMSFKKVIAPASISRYNLYTNAEIDIDVKNGYSTGEGIKETEELINTVLGKNVGYQWSGTALQEIESGSSMGIIFVLAFLVVFLVLAAQYESWTSPIAVILSVTFAVIGVVLGCSLFKLSISVYTQIGLILLIALSCKNSILIVAFSRNNSMAGEDIRKAEINGGNKRLRKIIMN